jgi:hypothetical protein
MVPYLIAAVLKLQIDLSTLVHHSTAEAPPSATCHITTVSYRFVGDPGTEFRYDGDTWHVPRSGSIELIASSATTYQIGGRTLPLDLWPRDEFGTRTVPLPRTSAPGKPTEGGKKP